MIRRAEFSDSPALAKLFRELHEHHVKIAPDSHRMPFYGYFELSMESMLADEERYQIYTEELDGALTCYAAVQIFDRERAERTPAKILYIEHFVVGEAHRRSGCGTRLFDYIRQVAKDNNCDCIQLGAAACNTSALSFYEKQGMTPRTIKLELKL